MSGQRITDRQVRRYMEERRQGVTQAVAAARAGMSERTVRRCDMAPDLPSQRPPRSGKRTRIDPLEAV